MLHILFYFLVFSSAGGWNSSLLLKASWYGATALKNISLADILFSLLFTPIELFFKTIQLIYTNVLMGK